MKPSVKPLVNYPVRRTLSVTGKPAAAAAAGSAGRLCPAARAVQYLNKSAVN